jgi:hypothetical protein
VLVDSPPLASEPRSRGRTSGPSEPSQREPRAPAGRRPAQRRPRDEAPDSDQSDWDVDPSPRGRPTSQRRHSYYRDGRSRSPVAATASPAHRWGLGLAPLASASPTPAPAPVVTAPTPVHHGADGRSAEDKVMGILRAQYQGTVADALRSAATKCGDATSYVDVSREKNSIIQDLQAVIARVHKAPDGALPASTLEELEALAWEVSHGPRGNDMPYAYAAAMRDLADEIDPRAGGSRKMRERLEKNAAAGRKLSSHSSGGASAGAGGGGGGSSGGTARTQAPATQQRRDPQPRDPQSRGGRGPSRGQRDDRRPGQGRDWTGR